MGHDFVAHIYRAVDSCDCNLFRGLWMPSNELRHTLKMRLEPLAGWAPTSKELQHNRPAGHARTVMIINSSLPLRKLNIYNKDGFYPISGDSIKHGGSDAV